MKKITLIMMFAFLGLSMVTNAQIPTNGLIGYWPFSGNANDMSGNGNNGTVNGATLTTDRFGNANSAYSFDGINDNILVQMNSALAPSGKQHYTYSLWFQSNPGNGVLMQIFTGTTGTNISNYDLAFNNSIIGFNHYPFLNNINSPDTTSRYIWTNILVDINQINDTIKFYKNGVFWYKGLVSSQSPSAGLLSIGALINNKAAYEGKIDDIRIYNRALSLSEINALYNENMCYQTITVTDTLIINANLTGFNPISFANTIKIYPNPTNDQITVNYGSNYASLSGYTMKITNSLGQNVYNAAISQQTTSINLNSWSGNGVYFVYLIDPQSNIVEVRKIVLQ